jgi:hypothetical protein
VLMKKIIEMARVREGVKVGERKSTTMIEFHAIREAIKEIVICEGVRNFV